MKSRKAYFGIFFLMGQFNSNMKYHLAILFFTSCLFSQTKTAGTYNPDGTFSAGNKTYAANPFSGGYARITDGRSFGMIDTAGTMVIPVIYESMGFLKDGLVAVAKGSKVGFVNTSGKEVIPFIYDLADDFSGGIALVRKNNKCGIIDKKGKQISPLIYDQIENFGNDQSGLARAVRNNKWGFISKSGKEAVPCIYMKANYFSDGLALVLKEDGTCGYVDPSGKVVVPFAEYTWADNFKKGKAEVHKGKSVFFINKKGEQIK
ncbi:MAG TPA: WG repeat-containing protein [Flavobacterium sp.]|nr:WG repeat-containing protein [Flavobacterium sp.]